MHAQLKAAQERLETATAQCLRSFEKLKSAQTNVCNSLRSHSSAKMAAVHDYDTLPAQAPETPAEAASENGLPEDRQDAQADYFDEDTQITLVVEELPEEKLTESKLLEKRQKSPKISESSQLGLAAP